MAKRRRKNTKRTQKKRRPLGSVIRVRTKGFGQLDNPTSVVGSVGPALIGILATGLTVMGLRSMTPSTPAQMKAVENAPLIGGLAGSIVSMLTWMMSGRPAGLGAAAGSTGTALVMMASEAMAKARMQNAGQNGLRAIVMEPHAARGYGAGPLGAIVPEYSSPNVRGVRTGAYGDTVNVKGGARTGNVNQAAFGTPGFNIQPAR